MAYNKVIYKGETLIDLTQDTVMAETLPVGITAHNAAGDPIVGTYEVGSTTEYSTCQLNITTTEDSSGNGLVFITFSGIYDGVAGCHGIMAGSSSLPGVFEVFPNTIVHFVNLTDYGSTYTQISGDENVDLSLCDPWGGNIKNWAPFVKPGAATATITLS